MEYLFELKIFSFFWEHANLFIFLIFIVCWPVFLWFRNYNYHKEDRELQIINPDYTPHPKRNLTHTEHEALIQLSREFFSKRFFGSNEILKILLSIFIIISVACYFFVIGVFILLAPFGLIFIFSPIVIGSIIAIVKTLKAQTKYYLDLRSPVFEMTTRQLLLQNSKKYGKKYRLRDIIISELTHPGYASTLENYPNGTLIRIEYSPHSKQIWSLEKVGL